MNVQVVLFDGFDLLDAVAPYEVLCAAGLLTPDAALEVQFVALEGPRDVPSGIGGAPLRATATLDASVADLVIVPGAAGDVAGDGPNSVPMILGRALQTGLGDALADALARPTVTVATVCGGSLLLGLAGALEGRHAVTHDLGMEALAATGALATRARVVVDGNLVSGGGVTSGLDVALHLTERIFGPRVAHAVESLFEYERRGIVWTETGDVPMAV